MYEESKAIVTLLHKRGFEAHFIGGKSRNELHNQYHPESKIDVKDIDIISNAKFEDVKVIFPNCTARGESFQVTIVEFGGFEFEIATYRKDIYDQAELKNSTKTVKPHTEIAQNLDEDRARRDYTINAIAQNIDGEYIDYVYQYRNKTISGMQDVKDSLIRAIGNPKQRFEEDPLRILRAFRFMAQLGYDIEKQTLKAIQTNLTLIEKIPNERISMEMNKLIMGKFASKALMLMQEIGMFKISIYNSLKKEKNIFLPGFDSLTKSDFEIADIYMSKLTIKQMAYPIDVWVLLLRSFGTEGARTNLESIYPVNLNDIEKVEWIIQYWDLIDSDDMKNDIFKARTGIVTRYKLMCLRELLKKLCKLRVVLERDKYEKRAIALIDTFCSRPYFHEQLKVNGEQLIEIGNEPAGAWISVAKDNILVKLINCEKFPKEEELYMRIVQEAVEQTIFDEYMKLEGL